MNELKAGVYKHYKGLLYLALGVALHTETKEKLVVYIPLGIKASPRICVRPYDMFFEQVEHKGTLKHRFTYLGEEVTPEIASQYDPMSGYSGTDRDDD